MGTAIVILNWNGLEHLQRFLPSVVASCPDGVRVVVADNGSTDGSVEWLRANYAQLRIIELGHNYGFAGGYNRALKQVEAEYYILLNSDVEVQAGWVEPLIERMEQNPDIGALAPKILSVESPNEFEYAGAAGGYIDFLGYPFCRGRVLSTVEQDEGQYDDSRDVFWVSGAAFCCRADLYESLGGFCEEFFAHMEEIDLCWRMQLSGYRVVTEPRSRVWHLGGGTLQKSSPFKTFLNFRNNLAMLFRCSSPGQRVVVAVVRPMLDMLAAALFLLKGDGSSFKAVMRAYRDFIVWHPRLNAERREIQRARKVPAAKHIYPGSIVLSYMLGDKKFKDFESK